jgi:CubicO group peptidase (beta-lactamase class C family)
MWTARPVLAAVFCMFLYGLSWAQPIAAQSIIVESAQRSKIDALFAAYDQPTSPGCALGVMSGGRIAYARGYGMATLDPPIAIDTATHFDVGSASKQFAAAIVVLLARQGKLKLTDEVRKYVPELPDYGTPITINHLIWHTSGLRNYTALLLLGGHDFGEFTTQELALQFTFRQRGLDFTPGSRFFYSNTGYILLALIAERVSGQSLDARTRRHIFDALGMPQSQYRVRPDLPIPNLALGYKAKDEGGFAVRMSDWVQIGDGGLHTSIEELAKWDKNFYSAKVGGPAFVKEMHRTGKLNDGTPLIYARGLEVDRYRGLRQVRHGGDSIGYHANILRFPDQQATVALLCNVDEIDQYTLSSQVADIILENAFTQPKLVDPPHAPSLPIERFVGDYFDPAIDQVVSIRPEDSQLVLRYVHLRLPLVSTGPTSFMVDGIPLSRVEFFVHGKSRAHAVRVKLYADESDESPVQARRFTPATQTDPGQFSGSFHSADLGVDWQLSVIDQQLTLNAGSQIVLPIAGPLSPAMTSSSFHSAAGLVRFTHNAAGQVDGFTLSFNRMRGIRFDRKQD